MKMGLGLGSGKRMGCRKSRHLKERRGMQVQSRIKAIKKVNWEVV